MTQKIKVSNGFNSFTLERNNTNITQTFLENRKRENTSQFTNDTSITFIANHDKATPEKLCQASS